MPLTRRAPVLIAVLALLWGSNFLWIKVALYAFTPVQVTFGRMLLGAVVLLVAVAVQRDRLPRDAGTWAHLTVAALVANAAPYFLFALGQTRVDSAIAGAINGTTPIWTLALALAIRQQQRTSLAQIGGFTLGLAGCLLIFAPWHTSQVDTLGALACLAAALCYAISFVYMARYLTPRQLTPTVLSAAQLIAATGWTALALPVAHGPMPQFHATAWLALLTLGAIGTGAAYIINYALIRSEAATGASATVYLIPAVSVTLGVAILNEPLHANLAAGTAIILAGIALSRRTPRTQPTP